MGRPHCRWDGSFIISGTFPPPCLYYRAVIISTYQTLVERASPFAEGFLKPQVLEVSPGKLKFRVPYRKEFIGNVAIPALHGGAVAAIIDHCGGLCAWSGLNDIAKTVGTVD